jgi:hypothetical protein
VKVSSRLTTVRGRGYVAMGHLEKSIELPTKKWAESAPLLKQTFLSNVQPLTVQIRILESEARKLRVEIDHGNILYSQSWAICLQADASSLKMRAISEASKISAPVTELTSSINAIDRDLKIAEKLLNSFSQASFLLKPMKAQS